MNFQKWYTENLPLRNSLANVLSVPLVILLAKDYTVHGWDATLPTMIIVLLIALEFIFAAIILSMNLSYISLEPRQQFYRKDDMKELFTPDWYMYPFYVGILAAYQLYSVAIIFCAFGAIYFAHNRTWGKKVLK